MLCDGLEGIPVRVLFSLVFWRRNESDGVGGWEGFEAVSREDIVDIFEQMSEITSIRK